VDFDLSQGIILYLVWNLSVYSDGSEVVVCKGMFVDRLRYAKVICGIGRSVHL
jgi:hypothetical protein